MSTIGYTPNKPDYTAAGALDGKLHRGGVQFPTRKLSDLTPVKKHQDGNRELWLVFERLWTLLMPLSCEHVSGLNVAVNPGPYRLADGTLVSFPGNNSFALDDDTADQCIWIAHATNTLAKGTSWPADLTTFRPIGMASTADGVVTAGSIRDYRWAAMMQTHATSTSPTGTNETAFTIDADNAGACAAALDLLFNRGTSGGGEDAALRWVEASALFRLLAQHTTGTLAAIDVLKVQVSGVDALTATGVSIGGVSALTADGAAKVQAAVAGDGLAHAAGVLAVNPDGTTLEIASDAVRVKDGGISTAKLNTTLAGMLVQVSISSASGSQAAGADLDVQLLDAKGTPLALEANVDFGVFDDAAGQTESVNGTLSVASGDDLGGTTKVRGVRTDSNGQATLHVDSTTTGTYHVLARPRFGSPLLDCEDTGVATLT